MRIAYDPQIFVLQDFGGISRYFTSLSKELLDMEQQVRIFAPLHCNNYLKSLPAELVFGRYIEKFAPKTTRLVSTFNRLASRTKISTWQPDLVHETYYARVPSAPKSFPVVITVYDMIHELFQHDFANIDNILEIKKIAIDRADHIICISENTKKDLLKLYDISESKISVVLLGFDSFAKNKINQNKIIDQKKPFLLYVGGRGGYKNFVGFIKALASSKHLMADFDLVFFGGGKFSIAERDLIACSGFAVDQVKQVSGGDRILSQYYSAAIAFVYPSMYEGFGMSPLEAMANDCPVICSNTSSMPEVIGNAGQYFSPSSSEDICQAIESLVYSESRIAELKALGRDRLKYFSWKKCAVDTLDVYRSITNR